MRLKHNINLLASNYYVLRLFTLAKQFIYLELSGGVSTAQSRLIFNFLACCPYSLSPLQYVNLKVWHSSAIHCTPVPQMKILFRTLAMFLIRKLKPQEMEIIIAVVIYVY